MSEESDSDSQEQKQVRKQSPQQSKVLTNKRSVRSLQKDRSFQSKVLPPPVPSQTIPDQTGLYEQNRKLRRKLKQLSIRLDEQLQKAAQQKLKQGNQKNNHSMSIQSQNMQLQNAYKMIERLQKTVHEYESKQSYQVTLKRVLDLENIIKKKQNEIEELKLEVKTLKKVIKEKDKRVEELIESTAKLGNPTQDKDVINKLKTKLKKVMQDNELLRKKQLEKHGKLVQAQRKIVEMQQQQEMPIGKEESLLQQIEEWKKKHKEAMQRVDRQNIYITKLNQKLSKDNHKSRKSERMSEKHTQNEERKRIASSLQDLPSLQKKVNYSQLLEHLPSPKQPNKLRRY